MPPVTFPPELALSRDQFYHLCQANPDLRLERTAHGAILIMPPTGWESGHRNAELTTAVTLWNRQTRLGLVFDSSTGFSLPNGADRAPDVAWVAQERIAALNPDPAKFLPLAPDFVIELRSATDKLATLEAKMAEYQDCGVRLGWLIDPPNRQVIIYRPGHPPERLTNPTTLSGDPVLPGFTLPLADIWG